MKGVQVIFVFVTMTTVVLGGPLETSSQKSKDIIDPYDFFEDLIQETLGLTVKELLERTEHTFVLVNNATTDGVAKLEDIISKASPEVKKELQEINEEVFKAVLGRMFGQFLGDLGSVLPKLSSVSNSSDTIHDAEPRDLRSAADIIRAILGKTLEVFVIAIKDALEQSSNILTDIMQKFKELEQGGARPEVAEALRFISNNYLLYGKTVIQPLLDDFKKLV